MAKEEIMNSVNLVGRLSRDPELKKTQNGTSVSQFSVAVPRDGKKEEGKPEADFINCVAWRSSADYLCRYGHKGQQIELSGKLQTRNYKDKDGKTVYITEVIADRISLLSKAEGKPEVTNENSSNAMQEEFINQGFDLGEDVGITSDDLPF